MNELNKEDRDRISATFDYGRDIFTEDDLENLRKDGETVEKKSKLLGDHFETFTLTWELLQDYWSGKYKNVPWKLLASIGFAVTYLVSPLDVIPDFLPLLGFTDDAAVFALLLSAFQAELDVYRDWKEKQRK